MNQALPFWLAAASVRRTLAGTWVVTLTANTQGVGCGFIPKSRTVRFASHLVDSERQAICRATNTPSGGKLRILARGCHIVKQVKAKYSGDDRKEFFSDLTRQMRAKYDGEHFLYESEAGQLEIARILNLSLGIAENYPVGLVVK